MARNTSSCHYCGARSAMVFKGALQQDLSCAKCGAPQVATKAEPKARKSAVDFQPNATATLVGTGVMAAVSTVSDWRASKKTSRKKPRSGVSRFIGGAFDVIEEIFD